MPVAAVLVAAGAEGSAAAAAVVLVAAKAEAGTIAAAAAVVVVDDALVVAVVAVASPFVQAPANVTSVEADLPQASSRERAAKKFRNKNISHKNNNEIYTYFFPFPARVCFV